MNRARDGAHADHAAAQHQHRVGRVHAPARRGVEADRQRFDQRQMARRQRVVQDQLAVGQDDVLRQTAVLLHAQRAVAAAGVDPALAAGRAGAAGGVGNDDGTPAHGVFGRNALSHRSDFTTDLVTGNPGQGNQRIQPLEGAEIAAAQRDMADGQQHFARTGGRLRHLVDRADVHAFDHQCFHR